MQHPVEAAAIRKWSCGNVSNFATIATNWLSAPGQFAINIIINGSMTAGVIIMATQRMAP